MGGWQCPQVSVFFAWFHTAQPLHTLSEQMEHCTGWLVESMPLLSGFGKTLLHWTQLKLVEDTTELPSILLLLMDAAELPLLLFRCRKSLPFSPSTRLQLTMKWEKLINKMLCESNKLVFKWDNNKVELRTLFSRKLLSNQVDQF